MSSQPRILTFNFHEPYLCLLAKTSWHFDVGNYEDPSLARVWHTVFRPIPENMHLVDEATWRARMEAGQYDVIIAQNETNALDIAEANAGKILICHNRRTFLYTTVTTEKGNAQKSYDALLAHLQKMGLQFVFISDTKKNDYGIAGEVIYPGIDLNDFGGYTGSTPTVIRVGNVMRQRDLMFDVDFQEACCAGLSNRVIGNNPMIPEAVPTSSFEELQTLYRENRCMLHVSREAYEDGYNLATLEAMATGMPVVTLSNPTSPIVDGVNGFSAYDAGELQERLQTLLEDVDLAKKLGAAGRDTVSEQFSIDRFVSRWKEVIIKCADERPRRSSATTNHSPLQSDNTTPSFLVHYVASPLTTGRYLERALRKTHPLETVGFRIPEEVLKMWEFPLPVPDYAAQNIPLDLKATYTAMKAALPEGFYPDYYLFIDSGPKEIATDIDQLPCTKVAYLIDTHVTPDLRLAMAKHFDVVFLAQKAQVELYRKQGLQHCYWLPLACSLELHDTGTLDRIYDVSYVGSFSVEEDNWRKERIERVMAKYPQHKAGRFWPEEMARIYAQTKVVVNAAYDNDVNMRVFEAMASGAMLLTDDVTGLLDLFEEGKHLVVYRNEEELFALLDHYLNDDAAREAIAQAGQAEVLAHHTYDLRIARMTETLQELEDQLEKPEVFWEIKEDSYYEHPRRELLPYIPMQTRRILDVGCGKGTLASLVKEERGLQEAAGIEIVESAWKIAKQRLDSALLGSIEEMELPYADNHFDCILCADVLEHLVEPELALKKLARVLAPDGVIVISIPNIQFFEAAEMLVSGGWTYMDQGIMDTTHLRFFTRPELRRMIERAGLEVGHLQPLSAMDEYRCPREANGDFKLTKLHITNLSDEEYENFRCYQWAAVVVKPGEDRLARARVALDRKENEAAYRFAAEAHGVNKAEQQGIMAKAMARLGNLEEAERCYQTALKKQSTPTLQGDYGILLVGMGRMDEAQTLLNQALEASPDLARARGALGLIRLQQGQTEEAHTSMLEALEANFESSGILIPFIQNALTLNQLDAAIATTERYCDFYPANADFAVALAELYSEANRLEEAIDKLEQTQIFHPTHEGVQQLLSRLKGLDT